MRAQLALLESVICMVLLFSAAYSVFIPASEEPSQFPSQLGPALFSLVSVYENNQSMHTCMNSGIMPEDYAIEIRKIIKDQKL